MVRRILLVDDHPLFLQGLAWVLGPPSDLAIVGATGTVAEALAQVEG